MIDNTHAVDDVVPEHLPQLGVGVLAMGAGRDENDDVLEADDAVELLEQRGYDNTSRLRACAVAHRDRDCLPRPDAIAAGARR